MLILFSEWESFGHPHLLLTAWNQKLAFPSDFYRDWLYHKNNRYERTHRSFEQNPLMFRWCKMSRMKMCWAAVMLINRWGQCCKSIFSCFSACLTKPYCHCSLLVLHLFTLLCQFYIAPSGVIAWVFLMYETILIFPCHIVPQGFWHTP